MSPPIPDNTALQTRFAAVSVHDVSEKKLPSGKTLIFETPSSADRRKALRDASKTHPLTVRRILTASGNEDSISVEIRSKHIIGCLAEVFKDYRAVQVVSSPVVLSEFRPLIHRFQNIWRWAYDDQRTIEERKDVEQLLSFICVELEEEFREFREVQESVEVTYSTLWACFIPGDIVVEASNDYTECYKVLGYTEEKDFFKMQCHQYNYAAGYRGYSIVQKEIPIFGGSWSITKLPFVPLHVRSDADKIRRECVAQGKLWYEVIGGLHCAYEGIACVIKDKARNAYQPPILVEEAHFVEGKVMIDIEAFQEANPTLRPRIDVDSRVRVGIQIPREDLLEVASNHVQSDLSDDQALLCPATAPGFAFQQKAWAKFSVRTLKSIRWETDMWQKLYLESTRKQYIWHFTANHDWAVDVLEDRKDLGFKYLLHGQSGSGKSLTVESLANDMRRPLFTVSEHNLRIWSKTAGISNDNALQHAFKWAHRWKALMFIDEADNFVIRNKSLTSDLFMAFLRQVEFFRGILFLATNKNEKDFDPAVLGRIDVIFHYECSDVQRKIHMWEDQLLQQDIDVEEASRVAKVLSEKYTDVNYRVIQKLIKLASRLATLHGLSLGLEALEEAMVLHRGHILREQSSEAPAA